MLVDRHPDIGLSSREHLQARTRLSTDRLISVLLTPTFPAISVGLPGCGGRDDCGSGALYRAGRHSHAYHSQDIPG